MAPSVTSLMGCSLLVVVSTASTAATHRPPHESDPGHREAVLLATEVWPWGARVVTVSSRSPTSSPDEGCRTRPGQDDIGGCFVMAWLVLIASGVLEAVWATALGKSDGFTKPVPSVIFAVGLLLSMAGLAYALREVPIGVGYAVWVG